MDVLAVETAAREAVEAVRRDSRPFLLELRTYRFRAHSMYDADLYRPREEIERWKARDPIALLRARLQAGGAVSAEQFAAIEHQVEAQVAAAVAEADAGALEPIEGLTDDVHTKAMT
jgi:TPP-dependent pyruvate/acetoin dehydrogenase alpha subunit